MSDSGASLLMFAELCKCSRVTLGLCHPFNARSSFLGVIELLMQRFLLPNEAAAVGRSVFLVLLFNVSAVRRLILKTHTLRPVACYYVDC